MQRPVMPIFVQSFLMNARQLGSPQKAASSGFSLVEVLIILALLSVFILPVMLLSTQTAQNARGGYIASSRNMVLDSLSDAMSAEPANFGDIFNSCPTTCTLSNALTDSGQAIAYAWQRDFTTSGASNALKRTVQLYLYTSTGASSSASLYKTSMLTYAKTLRLRFGTTPLFDAGNQYWIAGPSYTYDSTKEYPGLVALGTSSSTANDIYNTSGNNDALFQNYQQKATSMDFAADVENGAYTVKLYFTEPDNTVNATTNRRLMDISIEGSQVNNLAYSPWETTQGTWYGNILMYDVNVTDGTLNITLAKDTSSNVSNVQISGIEIRKRTL